MDEINFKTAAMKLIAKKKESYKNIIPTFIQDKNKNWYFFIFFDMEAELYAYNEKEDKLEPAGYINPYLKIQTAEEVLKSKELEIAYITVKNESEGLGSKMMNFYEKGLNYLNILYIKLLSTKRALKFYKKLGFVQREKSKFRFFKQVEKCFTEDEIIEFKQLIDDAQAQYKDNSKYFYYVNKYRRKTEGQQEDSTKTDPYDDYTYLYK